MSGRKRRNKVDNEINEAGDDLDAGPFTRGSIIRIRLINFMTYKDVELHAGPYLNMVLGPNGTGKSALVCALIVGLGGDPTATGRSGTLNEYVRFGSLCGITEIELFNPVGENYVIERKLVLSDGKCRSDWRLNGIPKKKSEIGELISSLNIRVNNLCQFLPQERVVEFARMNPKQLLENTQKAAGDENMFNDHEKLISISAKVQELTKKKAVLDEQLATNQHLTDRMAEQVERVREREKYKDKVAWLQKKKPWLEFEEVRQEYVEAKKNLEKREKELAKNKAKNKPLEEKVAQEKATMDKASKEFRSSLEELKSATKLVNTHKSDFDKLTDKINDSLAALEGKKKTEESRLKDLEKLKMERGLLQERLDNVSDADVTEQIEEVDGQINNKSSSLRDLIRRKDELNQDIEKIREEERTLKNQRDQIVNVEAKRRELLKKIDSKAYEAADWLRRNRNKFKRVIYEPILTQINVKSEEWIRYVEATIPRRDLVAFVCEDIEDLKKFTTTLKQEGLNVNVVQAPHAHSTSLKPKVPLDKLTSYGFSHFIKDLFDAPDSIVRYLCKNYSLHTIPVGGDNVDSSRFLKENNSIQKFFCGSVSHAWTISRYDQEKVISTDRIKDPYCLVMIVDIRKKRELDDKLVSLKQKYEALEKEKSAIESQLMSMRSKLTALKEKKKELLEKKDEKRILQLRLAQKDEQISRKMKEKIDLEEENDKTKAILESLVRKKMDKLEILNNALEKCVRSNTKKLASDIISTHAKNRLQIASRKLEQANEEFVNLEADIQRLKEIKDIKRKEAKIKQQNAQRAINSNDFELPKKVREQFKTLPDTIPEIDEEMRRLALRMESMEEHCDDSVLDEYNQQTNLIQQRKREIDMIGADLRLIKSDLAMYKARWIPSIQELISRIDKNFSKFMARLEYAGEVSLSHGDDPDDFSTYGISIKVRYRDNESLKELSAFHQSGGERSVATMIYMIALQELTKVPFRIVDEINQGMDDTNERRVFDLIVETASTNSSQYFLFSPKLLPGLTYTDRMHIHVIFNGPKFSVDWNRCKPKNE